MAHSFAGSHGSHILAWPLCALLLLGGIVDSKLLLDEDFSCAKIGCNATHQPTNYSYWRWSTTGSQRAQMHVGAAAATRAGSAVTFRVDYCQPPNPNPTHLGCYRSELALQRDVQDTLIDWQAGVGSSERWFGFSNRLVSFSFDGSAPGTPSGPAPPTPLNGPSFQLHGGGGRPALKGGHPNINLQVDSTGCADSNRSCPRWTLGVSSKIGGSSNYSNRCSEGYESCWVLGPALQAGKFDGWNDWVLQWRGSPNQNGYLKMWRNGKVVLPMVTNIKTTYDDVVPPYLKFGVYRGGWKGAGRPVNATSTSISYGALRVGDEKSSFAEVSTAQAVKS